MDCKILNTWLYKSSVHRLDIYNIYQTFINYINIIYLKLKMHIDLIFLVRFYFIITLHILKNISNYDLFLFMI